MRIGLFTTSLPQGHRKVGGVELFVHRLANALTDRGHDVLLHTFARGAPSDARYVIRRVGSARIAESKPGRFGLCPMILNRLNDRTLDVLNVHGDDWFFVRRVMPTVRTFHGSALREFQSATSIRHRALQAMVFPGELLASRLATASYTVCAGMPRGYRLAGTLPQGGGLFPGMVDLPADLPPFPEPTVLFVGTWEGRKRGRMLRDVFEAQTLRSHPNAKLLMVSDHCEESEHVRWIVNPDDRALSEIYARSWLFCLPSTYEGFGQPYVEAMAHGTPVLATPNPGIDYVSSDGRFAAVVDDDALGREMSQLLSDGARRRDLSTRGLRRAADFGWERSCEAHERAFEAAIEVHRRGRHRHRLRQPE